MAQTIKSCLDSLPGSTRTQIGFITYDSTIHFYNMKVNDSAEELFIEFLSCLNIILVAFSCLSHHCRSLR